MTTVNIKSGALLPYGGDYRASDFDDAYQVEDEKSYEVVVKLTYRAQTETDDETIAEDLSYVINRAQMEHALLEFNELIEVYEVDDEG